MHIYICTCISTYCILVISYIMYIKDWFYGSYVTSFQLLITYCIALIFNILSFSLTISYIIENRSDNLFAYVAI